MVRHWETSGKIAPGPALCAAAVALAVAGCVSREHVPGTVPSGTRSVGAGSGPDGAPVAGYIVSPAHGAVVSEGEELVLQAMASPTGRAGELRWVDSRQGPLGRGQRVRVRHRWLDSGVHIVELVVGGAAGSRRLDTVSVRVLPDRPPRAYILSPPSGARVAAGRGVVLWGSATDPEEGSLEGEALAWYMEGGRVVARGTRGSVRLPRGSHRILLVAADSGGRADTAVVRVTVTPEEP